jgi:hypothetical protein
MSTAEKWTCSFRDCERNACVREFLVIFFFFFFYLYQHGKRKNTKNNNKKMYVHLRWIRCISRVRWVSKRILRIYRAPTRIRIFYRTKIIIMKKKHRPWRVYSRRYVSSPGTSKGRQAAVNSKNPNVGIPTLPGVQVSNNNRLLGFPTYFGYWKSYSMLFLIQMMNEMIFMH